MIHHLYGKRFEKNIDRIVEFNLPVLGSMKNAIDETNRRRELQEAHNKKHGIIPQSVKRDVTKSIANIQKLIAQASAKKSKKKTSTKIDKQMQIIMLEKQMMEAAELLDFEKAIALRNEISTLRKK